LSKTGCPLCDADGGTLIHRAANWRVIRADDAAFPAFYRVVWNAHVAEFSDLSRGDRAECMDVVATVEQVLREQLQPTKINLAALGNQVPHLHWHVIARFASDSHFPDPVWAAPRCALDEAALVALRERLSALDAALQARLAARG
jgi:diadenosine tetraphosphate (Ap4A) HIT family hydrolase